MRSGYSRSPSSAVMGRRAAVRCQRRGPRRDGLPRRPVDRPEHEAAVEAIRAALDDEAMAEATAAGAQLSLNDAVAAASRGRGRRGRPASGWASLTPAEREVIRLVVARRLFVSRSTVKTHLSHIFARLEVGNRTELALLTRRHDDRDTPQG